MMMVMKSGRDYMFQFVPQNTREFNAYDTLEQILVCVYTIWRECQVLISCSIPSRSPPVVLNLAVFLC